MRTIQENELSNVSGGSLAAIATAGLLIGGAVLILDAATSPYYYDYDIVYYDVYPSYDYYYPSYDYYYDYPFYW